MPHRKYLLESGLSLAAGAIPILISGGGDYFYAESVESARNDSELLERGQYVYLPAEFVALIDRDDL